MSVTSSILKEKKVKATGSFERMHYLPGLKFNYKMKRAVIKYKVTTHSKISDIELTCYFQASSRIYNTVPITGNFYAFAFKFLMTNWNPEWKEPRKESY